jgi:hypothetical protein
VGAEPRGAGEAFDLNIERVLKDWTVAHAVREVIANALDEQILTNTAASEIYKDRTGVWHVRDHGRGLRYEHLTQNENKEKLRHPQVVGKFGVGLKDALAVFDRNRICVRLCSRHGDITTAKLSKHGFPDTITLHAVITPPSQPGMAGTDILLDGVRDGDVEQAKNYFLQFSGDEVMERTRYGEVLRRDPARSARIYIRGLCVAEEDDFLFSYNITALTARLGSALNRERSNVGRTAYTDRVKSILLECSSKTVADLLALDLAAFGLGRMHDELQWKAVAVHACRILNASERVLFVTPAQLAAGSSLLTYAQGDGCRLVVVPEDIARDLPKVKDLDGETIRDLAEYRSEWGRSFAFRFVEAPDLTPAEQQVYALTGSLLHLAGLRGLGGRVREVRVSETLRLDTADQECLGVWEPAERRIVIRRDQLADAARYAGTLLHEITHALSGAEDFSRRFEDGLTKLLGKVAMAAL